MTQAERSTNKASADDDNAPLFVSLGDYKSPSLPTDHMLLRLWNQLKKTVTEQDEPPFVTADRLSAATLEVLDEVVSPTQCDPLIDALHSVLGPWVSRQQQRPGVKLVVLPPCDPNHLLQTWAQQHGHCIVQPPSRDAVFNDEVQFPPDCEPGALLVIPRLEYWFLRHQRGLQAIRTLLAKIDALEQPCVIGCSSWAWAYLCTATGAATILPQAIVPTAFDAQRLHGWFTELASSSGKAISFRLASNGDDVMAADSNGRATHSHLKQLAVDSIGIPWVARLMWRESLRSHDDLEELPDRARDAIAGDQKTLWVAPLPGPKLSLDLRTSALLVFQSLLIHGGLSTAELQLTMPSSCDPDVIPALIATRFVERCEGLIQVRTSAYPQVRQLLATAGFPTDQL